MIGAVLILLTLFVVGPIALFVGGAIWSALFGWQASEEADALVATAQDSGSG